MSTEYSAPTYIVVRESIRQQAENAAVTADSEGGAGTFVPGTPLRSAGDDTNMVVAYWCRWNMKPSQRSAFASNMGGPINLLTVDKTPNTGHDKWLLDAADGQWSNQQVLDALGFDTLKLGWSGFDPQPPNWP